MLSSSATVIGYRRLLIAQLVMALIGLASWSQKWGESLPAICLGLMALLGAALWWKLDGKIANESAQAPNNISIQSASSSPKRSKDSDVLVSLSPPAAVAVIVPALALDSVSPALDSVSPPPSDDPYERVERLGEGNMGEVWRVRHRRLGRLCAIKQVRADLMSKQQIARFIREARVTAQLCSPHTVAVYDFGVLPEGSLFYAMELLDGIDLQRFVRRFGKMPAERVIHILIQACHSLEEAHQAGLVHRDLKPANLMLCRYGLDYDFIKIVDFGLAKQQESQPDAFKLTSDNTVLGTAAYLAPESLKGSSFVDGRADIYALGCLAFWLLTAELLFNYDRPVPMAKAHVADQPRHVTELVADLPLELDAIVHLCLAKKPEDRPQSAAALAEQLRLVPLKVPWTAQRAEQWWVEHQQVTAQS